MTIIQKIKHKLAVREAAKRRRMERAAHSQQHHATSLRMVRIRFGEIAINFGLN